MSERAFVSVVALVAYFWGINALIARGVPLWFVALVAVFGSLFGVFCVIVAFANDIKVKETEDE